METCSTVISNPEDVSVSTSMSAGPPTALSVAAPSGATARTSGSAASYVGVLGAEPEWVGRMDGCLSHLRIGSSLIDLQGYEAPGGRKLHGGGQGLPADAPRPEIDPTKGTLDHFAINLAPYDPEAVTEYLTAAGHAPYAQGRRYGADGDGYSIYLTDPEGTVVELKSGN